MPQIFNRFLAGSNGFDPPKRPGGLLGVHGQRLPRGDAKPNGGEAAGPGPLSSLKISKLLSKKLERGRKDAKVLFKVDTV